MDRILICHSQYLGDLNGEYNYSVNFIIDKLENKENTLLHFGAVDQIAKVFVNIFLWVNIVVETLHFRLT